MRTRRLLTLALGSLVAYGAILSVATVVRGSAEIFPFFSWQLFAGVPAPIDQDYGVRLTAADGRAIAPAVYFEDAASYISASHSISARALIQDLGRNLERKRSPQSARERAILESRYLQDLGSGRYQVVRRRFDVIDRVDCRCFIEEAVVAEFSLR